jgi:hypothetical protein
MKRIAMFAAAAAALFAADTLKIFDYQWTVPVTADWKVDQEDGAPILRMVQNRGPLPGPRRPIQFAIAETPDFNRVTVEADVKPLGRSLLIVFAYRDAAHFDYAHLSSDTGTKQPAHNGVFHVFGGERVRISSTAGPAAFTESNRWYRVKLTHTAANGHVEVTVDGKPVTALRAVDLSLGAGKVGLGSFDETAEFKNVKISGTVSQ